MANMKRIFFVAILLAGVITVRGYENAHGWDFFARTNTLYAVGEVGAGKSYLYTIDPLTGELNLIGDTGFNYCRGLDFSPGGKLKAFCEPRDGDVLAKNDLGAVPGMLVELDRFTGVARWAVPHGVSNNISDITITDDGVIHSYENLETDRFHGHVEENDFQADFIGEPGLDALDHAMGVWGADDIKLAANVNGPELYDMDDKTGDTLLAGMIGFPDELFITGNAVSSREIRLDDIQFASMDKVNFNPDLMVADVATKAGAYAFIERDAEFAVLMFKEGDVADQSSAVRNRILWAAIGLMDADIRRVDFIVEIQGEADVMAIAVREREPNPIPTISEWGLMALAALLGMAGLLAARRKLTA